MNPTVEILAARYKSSVDEKELSSQPMRERPPDGGFSRARRSIEKHSPLGLQSQLRTERIVAQRKHYVSLKAADHVVDALQIVQRNLVDLSQVHVARKALRAQIFDVLLRRERAGHLQPVARGSNLVPSEFRCEAINLRRIEFFARFCAEKDAEQCCVVLTGIPADTGGEATRSK